LNLFKSPNALSSIKRFIKFRKFIRFITHQVNQA
jgi:hypothetical protein